MRSDVSPQFVLEDEAYYTQPPRLLHDGASAYSFSSTASSGGPLTPQAAHGAGRDYFGQHPAAKEVAYANYAAPQFPTRSHQLEGRPGSAPLMMAPTSFDSSLPSLASPFAQAPPPSPIIAWNPVQRQTGGDEDDMETLVARPRARPTMAGRDTGEERKTVFWRRFSLVVHQAERQPEQSTWLRRHDGAVNNIRVMACVGLTVVCCLVGGLLAWHFLEPSTRPRTGNLSGLIERSTAPDAVDLAARAPFRPFLDSHGPSPHLGKGVARLRPEA